MQPWTQWQSEIVTLLKYDFDQALRDISIEDIDWPSWLVFYAQGRSPRATIERARARSVGRPGVTYR
jgi:hypothetical protein